MRSSSSQRALEPHKLTAYICHTHNFSSYTFYLCIRHSFMLSPSSNLISCSNMLVSLAARIIQSGYYLLFSITCVTASLAIISNNNANNWESKNNGSNKHLSNDSNNNNNSSNVLNYEWNLWVTTALANFYIPLAPFNFFALLCNLLCWK